ncbi:hypothetical protein [Mesorhizobium sp. WSM2239]|uniref:Uncharacterized protein n=2 Tax=unclassified Mesorhizobium TaxID=325217 RepID=A0AAU8DEW0_9HYPH
MKTLRVSEGFTLANICTVAATRFSENAAVFRQLVDQKPDTGFSLTPTGEAARQLAEQFEHQAAEATKLAEIFSDAEPFEVKYESA